MNCMFVRLEVFMFVPIHMCTLYVCMRVRMHVCTYSYVQCHAGMPLRNIHCIACLSVFICPCLCVGMLLCFCVQMSECMYTQMQWAHSLIIRTRCIYKCTGSMCVWCVRMSECDTSCVWVNVIHRAYEWMWPLHLCMQWIQAWNPTDCKCSHSHKLAMPLLMLQLMPLQPDIATQRAVDLAALRGAARMTQQPLPSPRAGFFLFAGLQSFFAVASRISRVLSCSFLVRVPRTKKTCRFFL